MKQNLHDLAVATRRDISSTSFSPTFQSLEKPTVKSSNGWKFFLALLFLMGCNLDLKAQTTYDWLNTAPDGNWKRGADGARWNPGGLWDEPGFGILRFNNNHQLSMNNNVSGTYSQHQIIFGSSATSSRTLAGNPVRLFDNSGSDPKIENQSTASHTISLSVSGDGDAGDPLELNPVSGDLTFSGVVSNRGANILVFGNNGKTITISGKMTGSGGFIVKQNSLAVLSGDNDYTGTTTVEAGRIRIQHANALGGTGNGTTVNSGAALEIWGAVNPAAEPLTLNGTGISAAGALRKRDTGSSTYSGTITLGSNSRINTDEGDLTLSGTINLANNTLYIGGGSGTTISSSTLQNTGKTSSDGALYKNGSGTLTISGASTISGAIRLIDGGITISGAFTGGDAYIAASKNLTINENTSLGSLRENGTGNSGTASIASGKTLTVNGASKGTYFMNSVTGAGTLTYSSSGTSKMLLFGSTSVSNVTVTSGTNGMNGGTFSSRLTVSGGIFSYEGGTFSSAISTLAGGGNFSVASSSAGLTLGAQELIISASGSSSQATITTASGKNLSLGATSSLTFTNFANSGAPMTVSGGGSLALNASTAVRVHIPGSALDSGTYDLIGAGVSGTAPSAVSFTGGGIAGGASAALSISSGKLVMTVTSAPEITVSSDTLSNFGSVAVGGTSASANYNVTGLNISGDITVTAPANFQVATASGGTYGSSITLASTGGTVHVRFAPGTGGALSGAITNAATGASSKTVAVSGTGIEAPGTPTATARTSPTFTTFVANWSSGTGGTPTNYLIDVARDSGFSSMVSGYNNRSVGNVTSVTVTNLAVGEYYYRVRAQNLAGTSGDSGTITARTSTVDHRNAGGASAPYSVVPSSSGTYYVGDTLSFLSRSWDKIGSNAGRARLWVHTGVNVREGSTSGDWNSFTEAEERSRDWKFTSAGTYYWGMQLDYGAPYGTNFWYVRDTSNWAAMDYNGTNGNLTVTITALSPPTSPGVSAHAPHLATALELSWTRWNSRNVLIVRRANSAVTWTPTANTSYSNGQDVGDGHSIVRGSTSSTSLTDHNLLPGVTYHYAFFSENGNYYSATSTTANRATVLPQARNTGGVATPQQPATIYLGDTNLTFGFDSWGTITRDGNTNFGRARLWIRHNNADVSGGTSTAWTDFVNVVNKTRSSPQFTQTGTWYWGMQMDYGSPYSTNFWYKASSSSYSSLAANGEGSTLSVTVSALGTPAGFGATADGANAIDLAWTRWTGDDTVTRNVLIVRKAGSAVSWTPTQGTQYTDAQDVGDGHTVIRRSLAANLVKDTGLTAGTTYHYAIFSENFRYYSAAATASATTPKIAQTITFTAPTTKTYGDAAFGVAATSTSGLTVSFESLTPSIVTVSGTNVTIVGTGTATIRASQAGNATYDAAPNVDRSFTVNAKAVTGSFTAESKTYNATTNATVTGRSLNGVVGDDDVSLSGGSAYFDTATAGNNKTVRLYGATLAGADAGKYTLSSVSTTTANITKASQTITFASGGWQSKTVGDEAFELVASASSGLAVSFSSSTPGVATVSGSTVTIVGAGTTTITASQAGDTNYDAATSVERVLTVGADSVPVPAAPTAYAGTAVKTDSFQANWSAPAGAVNYRLDVSTNSGFASFVTGYNGRTVESTSVIVTGLTAGATYYYRVRAVNSENEAGDNSSTITVMLPPEPVASIASIPTNQLAFVATPGVTYQVIYSDSDPGTSMSWSTAATVTPGNSSGSAAITETSRRYFQVVVQGETPSTQESAIWGIIKPSMPAGYSLFSPPLAISDLSFTGQLGQVLGSVLNGNADKASADFVSIRSSGNWTKYWLDNNKVWRNFSNNSELTNQGLLAGQGMYVYSASSVAPRFTGPVGNTGSKTVAINSGDWNIIGVSEGKDRTIAQLVFEGGTPASGNRISAQNYDMIVIDTGGGAWRTFARINGQWLDTSGSSTPAVIRPGDGVYYYRHGAAGMSIRF